MNIRAEPTTENGRRLLMHLQTERHAPVWPDSIVTIEAEAVMAERARIKTAVGRLEQPTLGLKDGVNRAAVLAIIEEAS